MVKGIYINEITEFLFPVDGRRGSSTTAVMGIYKITSRFQERECWRCFWLWGGERL